jgi:hypothetical protein
LIYKTFPFFNLTDAYKDNFVAWKEIQGKVLRPNLECTNGYIHLVDTVMIDDTPPWAVGSAFKQQQHFGHLLLVLLISISFRQFVF